MARAAASYRAARRNRAKRLRVVWRALDRVEMQGHGSPLYVPMIRTQEEADGRR